MTNATNLVFNGKALTGAQAYKYNKLVESIKRYDESYFNRYGIEDAMNVVKDTFYQTEVIAGTTEAKRVVKTYLSLPQHCIDEIVKAFKESIMPVSKELMELVDSLTGTVEAPTVEEPVVVLEAVEIPVEEIVVEVSNPTASNTTVDINNENVIDIEPTEVKENNSSMNISAIVEFFTDDTGSKDIINKQCEEAKYPEGVGGVVVGIVGAVTILDKGNFVYDSFVMYREDPTAVMIKFKNNSGVPFSAIEKELKINYKVSEKAVDFKYYGDDTMLIDINSANMTKDDEESIAKFLIDFSSWMATSVYSSLVSIDCNTVTSEEDVFAATENVIDELNTRAEGTPIIDRSAIAAQVGLTVEQFNRMIADGKSDELMDLFAKAQEENFSDPEVKRIAEEAKAKKAKAKADKKKAQQETKPAEPVVVPETTVVAEPVVEEQQVVDPAEQEHPTDDAPVVEVEEEPVVKAAEEVVEPEIDEIANLVEAIKSLGVDVYVTKNDIGLTYIHSNINGNVAAVTMVDLDGIVLGPHKKWAPATDNLLMMHKAAWFSFENKELLMGWATGQIQFTDLPFDKQIYAIPYAEMGEHINLPFVFSKVPVEDRADFCGTLIKMVHETNMISEVMKVDEGYHYFKLSRYLNPTDFTLLSDGTVPSIYNKNKPFPVKRTVSVNVSNGNFKVVSRAKKTTKKEGNKNSKKK